jgi:hypothetical protein
MRKCFLWLCNTLLIPSEIPLLFNSASFFLKAKLIIFDVNTYTQRVLKNDLSMAKLSCCRMIRLHAHPLSRQQLVSLSQSSCVSQSSLLRGEAAPQESLALYINHSVLSASIWWRDDCIVPVCFYYLFFLLLFSIAIKCECPLCYFFHVLHLCV